MTGAAGMLGRDLVPLLGDAVTAVDMEVDVTDADAVERCVAAARPRRIFHLAAWTDVDGAEANSEAAFAVNADGTRNVARAAAELGAELVVVSTDYVFDGTSDRPYVEDDAVSPVGVYGRSKAAGESAALQEYSAGTRIVRTAWLYGAGGHNFVDTMRAIGGTREEVTVVADQVGSPTWTCDLAPALVAISSLPAGIYHAAGAGSVSWAGFAEAVFAEAGMACRVVPVTTAEFGRPAPRPPRSVLASTRPGAPRLRPWREALADYLEATA